MSRGEPDYRHVHVPKGKRPAEYDWRERRADLLRRIHEAGGPHFLNKSDLAREYDVARTTLYNDLEKLREAVDGRLGEGEGLEGEALLWRTIERLTEDAEALRAQGEHAQAAKADKEAARVFTWLSEWRKAETVEEILERLAAVEERVESQTDTGLEFHTNDP